MKFLLLFLLFCASIRASVYYPSSTRFGIYQPGVTVGVVGGIPARAGGNVISVTTYGWSAEASAATNAAAFFAAVAASAEGDIISIPAGTFSSNTIGIGKNHPNRTVRGAALNSAGEPTTIIQGAQNLIMSMGESENYGNPSNPTDTITAMTYNSNVIAVSSGSLFPGVGPGSYRIARIELANEIVTPVFSTNGYEKVRQHTVLMTGRSGNNITLSQPLPSDFAAGATGATFSWATQEVNYNFTVYGVGWENIHFDASVSSADDGVKINQTQDCWMKDCKISGYDYLGAHISNNVNFEMRGTTIVGPALYVPNRGGIRFENNSYCLIEDNRIKGNFPDVQMNYGNMNNVFAFNYIAELLVCNHGPWNSHNLYEGNVCLFIQTDGLFGGSSEETDFRNFIRAGDAFVSQKRGSRYRNIVANLVGTPGETYLTDGSEYWGTPYIGNNGYSGTARPSTGDWWADWDTGTGAPKRWPATITTITNNTPGSSAGTFTLATGTGSAFASLVSVTGVFRTMASATGVYEVLLNQFTVTDVTGDVVTFTNGSWYIPVETTAVNIVGGPLAFNELDEDVALTTIRKANYYVMTGDIPSGESLGADTLPNSYFRSSKPAWFGDRPWPPFNSASPGSYAATNIPAGWREVNGNTNYLGETPVAGTPVYRPGGLRFFRR